MKTLLLSVITLDNLQDIVIAWFCWSISGASTAGSVVTLNTKIHPLVMIFRVYMYVSICQYQEKSLKDASESLRQYSLEHCFSFLGK